MVVETKRRILNYHRSNVEARQELNIQPRWNYDISRQLKDLETRQRWTKARAMGRAQHDSVGRSVSICL